MEPVALGVKTPDVLERLSSVLGIKSQLQGLEGQAAEVAGAKQTQAQRQGIADYFKANPLKHVGPDGLLDVNGMLVDPDLRNAAGDQLLPVLQSAAANRQQGIQNMQALTNLRGDQREAFAGLMNSLRGDKDVVEDTEAGRQKVTREMLKYGEVYGPEAYSVLSAYSQQLREAPRGHLADELKIIGMQGLAAGQQMTAQQPQFADTGGNLLQVSPNALPSAPASIRKTVSPGFETFVDPRTGNPYTIDRQNRSVRDLGAGGGGGGPAPNASPSAAPGSSMPAPFYPGQKEDIQRNQEEVRNVRSAADQAPVQANIFRNILKLSDSTNTGPLVKFFQDTKIGGQAFGDNYQELAKYLEKNAISAMQAMGGPGSDARLSAAVAATGSTDRNPRALKAITQFNYAANTGLEMYRKGLDKAVGTTTPDYVRLPEFKAAWAQNFDIDALRLENAVRDGDKKAQSEILNSLSAGQKKELAAKLRNLESLSTTGKLP